MPGQMEYREVVKVTASATFTFPTDEANRIIGRAHYRKGLPDVVLESITISRGASSSDNRGLEFADAKPWDTVPRANVRGRLILQSGALGKELVDIATEVWARDRAPKDDPRIERIAEIVRACWAEFEQKTGTAKDVLSRVPR